MKSLSLSKVGLIAGLAFLYAPLVILVGYSFNASKLVTIWGGFSTKWYGELMRDEQILDAVWTSLVIAFNSATMAVILGTLAAMVITRFRASRLRTSMSTMVTAPLVMPEVITGLSLLLLFVHMADFLGWPAERGRLTIWIAHSTFSAAYVAVIVSSRLRELDRSIEEAAMDLGASPMKTFMLITVPMIAPSLMAGWLLAFSLSLDDLVIASFTSGPGATTLPMVVFSSVRMGVSPKINALATLIIVAVALVALVSWYFMRRKPDKC
ncbi:ABC transporter permease subunit [Shewanella sp. NIFS-20-20]|uniref:ABC transporter permease subunit n=1 Tax=Shewanella sp. NIFS-20-20 TaxID=2853806 RepID=UPI001C489365|nr:ABC transporter permease subunit [Shewanella sp. NIFS-20-20]MBV7314520.1 ABC transporter permease subunit [Shewanella sp. NIFS-20-20]